MLLQEIPMAKQPNKPDNLAFSYAFLHKTVTHGAAPVGYKGFAVQKINKTLRFLEHRHMVVTSLWHSW
jgi:hypothetical protein